MILPFSCCPSVFLWYRSPKTPNCPKWLGEGAKDVLTSWRKGLPRVSCTSAALFCTSATLFCTNATGFWSTCAKASFAPSPNDFWPLSRSRAPVAGAWGRKAVAVSGVGKIRGNCWIHFPESRNVSQVALQRCKVDFSARFWKVNFGRWISRRWIYQGASSPGKNRTKKIRPKNSGPEFGRPKFV